MTELLKELNKVGLIERLDGDDDRFTKIEKAATNVAKSLKEDPPKLIRAILAGLDPEIPADDPAISLAENALIELWTSMRSIHTDPPIQLYRYILLDACNQCAEKTNAVILWGTAADTLPTVKLGKEESVIRGIISEWARKAEEHTLITPSLTPPKRQPGVKNTKVIPLDQISSKSMKRDFLQKKTLLLQGLTIGTTLLKVPIPTFLIKVKHGHGNSVNA